MSRINEIVSRLKQANEQYDKDGTGIPEGEYLSLMKELKEIDPENELLSELGEAKVSSKGKIKHEKPKLSLDKVYTIPEVKKWMKKVSRTDDEVFCVNGKFDGLTGVISDGSQLLTRGDGEFGEDISHQIPIIDFLGLPITPHPTTYDGEILITHENFEKYFKSGLITRGSGELYKSPRNVISGIMNKDKPVYHEKVATHIPFDYGIRICNVRTVEEIIEQVKSSVVHLPTDGIVIKLADKEYGDSLGCTSHHYKHSIALKHANESAQTVLRDVKFQMAKESIGMVGVIDPIEINGVTIKRVTLHNLDIIKDLDLMIGDDVTIERAGDVIPHIVDAKVSAEHGRTRTPIVCEKCPSCGSEVYVDVQFYKCPNPDCHDKVVNRIEAGCKDLGIKGISTSAISKLLKKDLITDISDLFSLDSFDLQAAGYKNMSRSMLKFMDEIDRVSRKETYDYELFAALNIAGFGKSLFKKLFKKHTYKKICESSIKDDVKFLSSLENISNLRASILSYGIMRNEELIIRLEEILNVVSSTIKEGEVKMEVKTICFTGAMDHPRDELERIARTNGFEPAKSVTMKLDVLVVQDPTSNSNKIQKANKYNDKGASIEIWSADHFVETYIESE